NTFGQSCLLARRLIEAGTRVVEVIWPKVANSDNHSWDHHVDLTKRMKNQSGPMLDRGLSAFISDMDDRGLLKETLVVAIGEFGRSPQKGVSTSGNSNSADGRELHLHHCRCRHQARLRPRQVRQDRQQPRRGPGPPG